MSYFLVHVFLIFIIVVHLFPSIIDNTSGGFIVLLLHYILIYSQLKHTNFPFSIYSGTANGSWSMFSFNIYWKIPVSASISCRKVTMNKLLPSHQSQWLYGNSIFKSTAQHCLMFSLAIVLQETSCTLTSLPPGIYGTSMSLLMSHVQGFRPSSLDLASRLLMTERLT